MSLKNAKAHLAKYGLDDRVRLTEESSATVELAAQALGVEAGRIAKTLAYLVEDKPVLILAEGTARIDNRKYKDFFHTKAKMIPFDQVETLVGHAPGGVCPFGINPGIKVYLDISLKKYPSVFPAAGESNSDIELTIPQLEQCSESSGWIDVCKNE
ncbi:YbaK/EbsC family protein [uncultured Treponema sp.]|uniref:YbaK/EbsC family protein n=1 Tax=uncultured Treponema sp. TaxID=162155 RepID=UPI0025978373|nr:YbaK/EbsC family protein [uncultured Treponema sp.]